MLRTWSIRKQQNLIWKEKKRRNTCGESLFYFHLNANFSKYCAREKLTNEKCCLNIETMMWFDDGFCFPWLSCVNDLKFDSNVDHVMCVGCLCRLGGWIRLTEYFSRGHKFDLENSFNIWISFTFQDFNRNSSVERMFASEN